MGFRRRWAALGEVSGRLAAAMVAVLMASLVAAGPSAAQDAGGFSDVTQGVHKPAIDALAALGVFVGTACGEAMFCPGDEMKRSTMAVWLVRVLDSKEPPSVDESSFADVVSDEWWLAHVERLAALEVTKGCLTEPLRYCPDESVTRAQMATFLVRALDLEAGDPAGFVDTAGNFHEASIDALAAAGVTAGCKVEPLRFCPDEPVTRAQMATFVARALGLVEVPTAGSEDAGDADADSSDTGEDALPESAGDASSVVSDEFAAVSAGAWHTCAVSTTGGVACWGYKGGGRTDVAPGAYTAVSAGGWHSCGVRTDGAVRCWGANTDRDGDHSGQSNAPAGSFVAVSAGWLHSCGLRTDGTVECWGANTYHDGSTAGQIDAPAGTFTHVDVGPWHSCGLRTDGTIECWGDNRSGKSDPPEGTFISVSAGGTHTCGLRSDGTVECWGDNQWRGGHSGQVDAPGGTFTSVSAGDAHTCGLRPDGTIECWGANTDAGGDRSGQADAPEGDLQGRFGRQFAHVRDAHQWPDRMLGRQRLPPGRPSRRLRLDQHKQGCRRRLVAHVRHTRRRHCCLLGIQVEWTKRCPARHLSGPHRQPRIQLRDPNR